MLTLSLAACGSESPAGFQAPLSRAGHLIASGEQVRFVPCGETGDGAVVRDHAGAGALIAELGGGEDRIPALVRLDGDSLAEIRFAGPRGLECGRLPPEGELEAKGNEPFWMARVEGSRATVTTPDLPDGVAYREGAWSGPAPGILRYEARNERDRLALEIQERRCSDGMSGARYPFTAALTWRDQRMEGCALEGRAAQRGPDARSEAR